MRGHWSWLVLSAMLTMGVRTQNLPMPGQPSDNLATDKGVRLRLAAGDA